MAPHCILDRFLGWYLGVAGFVKNIVSHSDTGVTGETRNGATHTKSQPVMPINTCIRSSPVPTKLYLEAGYDIMTLSTGTPRHGALTYTTPTAGLVCYTEKATPARHRPRTPTQRTFQPQEAVQPQRNQTIRQRDTPAQKAKYSYKWSHPTPHDADAA